MRAWEILENRNPPSKPITIRALHKMKLEAQAKKKAEQERFALFPLMYGDTDYRREQLELERMTLELQQLRQELRNETESSTYKAIGKIFLAFGIFEYLIEQ
jgi:hypothetical protein